MLAQDVVEVGVVPGFLVVHVLHQRAQVRVGAHDDGVLRGVDEDGGEFAGLVNAQRGGEEVPLFLRKGADRLYFFGRGIARDS